jgi:hypothetical protein
VGVGEPLRCEGEQRGGRVSSLASHRVVDEQRRQGSPWTSAVHKGLSPCSRPPETPSATLGDDRERTLGMSSGDIRAPLVEMLFRMVGIGRMLMGENLELGERNHLDFRSVTAPTGDPLTTSASDRYGLAFRPAGSDTDGPRLMDLFAF